ncbi:MAG: signal peptide peptidase SppA [Firmicutes bacterium]|nr:signal peptide peptidase SppA [Bacillota bacterium]MBR3375292.1 signal peptide peptidase SppA [Bacillota bacterium]MBR6955584.1 signal peptide peptidase SppA [Bacillota bacterium]
MDNFDNRTPDQEPEKKPEQGRTPQGAPKTEQQKVYYRPYQQYQQQQYQQQSGQTPGYVPQGNYQPVQRAGMPSWLKVLLIVALIMVLIIYLMGSCVAGIGEAVKGVADGTLTSTGTDVTTADAKGDYIGILHVEGTISEGSTAVGYNHNYNLNSISDMAKDDRNKGIILYLNTPGGSVYASDELYFAIKDYQEKTKRPVYASMQSMAASGGYYVSAPCDKIYSNRNGITGSIGVTMGEMYDVTELMEKLGVKATAITSGRNKAMGSSTQELTEEQMAIFQSIIDEAYDQFTGIVAEGRGMDIETVRELADGRIYTAAQAKENGLIDEVGTYDDCLAAMIKDNALGADVQILDFVPAEEMDIMSLLGMVSENLDKNAAIPTADQIRELMDLNNSFRLMYILE